MWVLLGVFFLFFLFGPPFFLVWEWWLLWCMRGLIVRWVCFLESVYYLCNPLALSALGKEILNTEHASISLASSNAFRPGDACDVVQESAEKKWALLETVPSPPVTGMQLEARQAGNTWRFLLLHSGRVAKQATPHHDAPSQRAIEGSAFGTLRKGLEGPRGRYLQDPRRSGGLNPPQQVKPGRQSRQDAEQAFALATDIEVYFKVRR